MSYTGEGEQFTLSNTLMVCMLSNLRMAVHAQVQPQWLQALAGHPPTYKLMFINGRLVRKRALPYAIAVPLVAAWIPAAIETIRLLSDEASDLAASLAVWDQAVAAAGNAENAENAENIKIVEEGEGEE
jgi:hypothetical protein